MASAGVGAVRLLDQSGDPLDDDGGKLKVSLDGSSAIDIGDVDMFLNGHVALLGGDGDVAPGVLRVTLADNDNLLENIPNVIGTDGDTGPTKCLSIGGTVALGGAIQELQCDSNGILMVEATSASTFAVQISDTSFAVADDNALGEGILVQGDDGNDRKNIHVDATTGDVQVDVTNLGDWLLVNSGTAVTPSHVATENYTAADGGFGLLAVRNDDLAALTSVQDGDYTQLQVSAEGALYTTHGMTGMVSGVNSSIGTSAEQLDGGTDGYDVPCKRIDFISVIDNDGDIWVGDSGVTTNGLGGGIKLKPGDFYSIDINNLTHIWVIAATAQKIHYNYFT